MAKSGIDDGEIWVNPKKKAAQEAAKAAASKPAGGAEELPGSPRPAKPGRSSIPEESDADHRRQRPGRVEEDAEIWDGEKWVLPSGRVVDESAGPKGSKGNPTDGPTVEADDDTEVISTPRKAVKEQASGPLFGGPTSRDIMRSGGKAAQGRDGEHFDEYVRPAMPDANAKPTFGLGGFVPYGASVTPGPPREPLQPAPKGYVPLVPTAPGQPVAPKGATMIWPPPAGGHPMVANPGAPAADLPRASPKDVHANALPRGQLNVLLIGSGAREHAMAAAIRRSQRAHLFVVTKHRNPGLVKSATGFKILDDRDVAGIVAWAKMQKIQLAVTGPESALEAGVTDALRAAGIAVASPSQAAARIETSKTFMRELMRKHKLPGQLGFHAFTNQGEALRFLESKGPVWAIKPVGLTGGKGVQVYGDHFTDLEGAKLYVHSVFQGNVGGGAVQFEELARGEEFTVMAFTDGTTVLPMPAVQDHKRLLEGDKGPNTGGMGSYSCPDGLLPFLSQPEYDESVRILQSIVDALRTEGTPYVGTIYGQFMLTAQGPKVIEVNARFGDPEAMNVLHTLESDYLALLEGMATGTLAGQQARFRPTATVVKYVVPRGYGDGTPAAGKFVEIDNFGVKRVGGAVYFGSIEQIPSGTLATMASRTVGVLGEGPSLAEANAVCDASLRHIHGESLFVRRDIGSQALVEQRVRHMNAVRQEAAKQAMPKAQ
ncbi:MAG: phosphoribosylamine--glycine ligase [Candidatus Thermoplasmatota archaeon]